MTSKRDAIRRSESQFIVDESLPVSPFMVELIWPEIRHDFVTAWHGMPQRHREGPVVGLGT
jgi:hypothetical protein